MSKDLLGCDPSNAFWRRRLEGWIDAIRGREEQVPLEKKECRRLECRIGTNDKADAWNKHVKLFSPF